MSSLSNFNSNNNSWNTCDNLAVNYTPYLKQYNYTNTNTNNTTNNNSTQVFYMNHMTITRNNNTVTNNINIF